MDNTIWKIEAPKFDYEITINYELIRDFAGDALSSVIYQVDHDYIVNDLALWNVLALVCLDEAIAEYCRDPQSCNNNESLRNVNDFGDRKSILKTQLMKSLSENSVKAMLSVLKTGWRKTQASEMFTAVMMVYDDIFNSSTGLSDQRLSIIVSALLYTDKYLAFKEYCNLNNSELARELLHDTYNKSDAAVWNREQKHYSEYWCSLRKEVV